MRPTARRALPSRTPSACEHERLPPLRRWAQRPHAEHLPVRELGHVVRGHTRLLADLRSTRLAEISFDRNGPPSRVARAWELQADQTAFAFLWSYAINTTRQRTRFLRQLKCTSGQAGLERSVHRTSSSAEPATRPARRRQHPPAALRGRTTSPKLHGTGTASSSACAYIAITSMTSHIRPQLHSDI